LSFWGLWYSWHLPENSVETMRSRVWFIVDFSTSFVCLKLHQLGTIKLTLGVVACSSTKPTVAKRVCVCVQV